MPQSALSSSLASLKRHQSRLQPIHLRQMFKEDTARTQKFHTRDHSLVFDFSKNRIDADVLAELVQLVKNAGVAEMRDAMFGGEKINFTEARAVLHTALRAPQEPALLVDGKNIKLDIAEANKRLFTFANSVRDGTYKVSGGVVSDIVNIGIGGSDLGPVMCVEALAPFHDGPQVHFVSNVDGADFHDSTKGLNPHTTLFIIASKTFTTKETMANAKLAKDWIGANVEDDKIGGHFVALSTNLVATAEFGIDENRIFGFWDWVGGRYSVWSAIGLSLLIAIGQENFQQFLDGAHAADTHFVERDFEENIPVLMAMIGIWHRNVWEHAGHAILPYDNRLLRFPAYLQQLDMESNGKHVCQDGSQSKFSTGPIIWGEPGTNGQHAFFQLLHQGTDIVPCDFLIAANSHEDDQAHQKMLIANCFAQSKAMMVGRSVEEVREQLANEGKLDAPAQALLPHKVFEGNRPSNTFLYEKLTPFVLGQLLAFYEHKVFVQGIVWGINSFDQWGVELGKQLANEIEPLLDGANPPQSEIWQDASTGFLIENFQKMSK